MIGQLRTSPVISLQNQARTITMSGRLQVNPGTPQAWEILLKPGTNRIGRGEQNDFRVNHSSVSTVHCELVVHDDQVLLKDLGSTNGTFVDRAPVSEIALKPGQHVQLGSVEMIFQTSPKVVETAGRVANPVQPLAMQTGGLRIGKSAEASTMTLADPPVVNEVEEAFETSTDFSPSRPPLNARVVGAAFCKFHPKTAARFLCESCQKFFCDMCVTTRTVGAVPGRFCRACGSVCVPVQSQVAKSSRPKGFLTRLPGAFGYPFRGSGLFLLVGGTVLYLILQAGLKMMQLPGIRFFIYGIMVQLVVGGYLFAFMQSIIHTTATGDDEMPSMPSVTNMWDDVLLPVFQLIGMSLLCFSPAILLGILSISFEVPALALAAFPAAIVGCVYFPMAFLAVVILDTVKAVNPLVVIPSILRVPGEYALTLFIFAVVYGIRALGDFVMTVAFPDGVSTKSMSELFLMIGLWAFWSVAGFYLIVVNMRILGLLYVTKRERLGWLSR